MRRSDKCCGLRIVLVNKFLRSLNSFANLLANFFARLLLNKFTCNVCTEILLVFLYPIYQYVAASLYTTVNIMAEKNRKIPYQLFDKQIIGGNYDLIYTRIRP